MKAFRLKKSSRELLRAVVHRLERQGRLKEEKNYMQHGSTTVWEHSVHVAYVSLCLAEWLCFNINQTSLLRGALLHDYFLYDWHDKDRSHRLHGLFHAGTALRNARRDYQLNRIEENIISRHMFPVNPIFPGCRESWIVCLADKFCALVETFYHGKRY